jgi:hypothetical protein
MTARAEAIRLGLEGTAAAERPITASRTLPHRPEEVFAFLADLDKHWRLTDRYLRLDDVAPDQRAGRIAIRSPIGLHRTARTEVTTMVPPERFGGLATVGRRTCARVVWHVRPHDAGAHVELEATVLEASPADRLLLALGGRAWLRRRFEGALARLASELAGG